MKELIAKIVIVLLCSTLVVGTASAQTESSKEDQTKTKSEKTTIREKVEAGKKVGIHKIIKSGDPELIYPSSGTLSLREKRNGH